MFADAARHAAHVAARVLGWRPEEFWAATPAELVTALGLDAARANAPVDAGLLAGLMEQYPDGC
ncbi:phage tail assembly chaperone [Sandarakinorhabdus oryzae]|uniref:phage tail assembly chaperone n=1 Tax=Sandarakinorhabdus oryzae TaxID=2675220 RepID=UPI0012E1EDBD|nr:phage tail assembly chaperone [Sandarakinorhabdus oryzae]